MTTTTIKLNKSKLDNIILEEIEKVLLNNNRNKRRRITINEGLERPFFNLGKSVMSKVFGKTADDGASIMTSKFAGVAMSATGKQLAAKAAAQQLGKQAGEEIAGHELKKFINTLAKEAGKASKEAFETALEKNVFKQGDDVIGDILKNQAQNARLGASLTEDALIKQGNRMVKSLSDEATKILTKNPNAGAQDIIKELGAIASKKFPKAPGKLVDDCARTAETVAHEAVNAARRVVDDVVSQAAKRTVVKVASTTFGQLIKELGGSFLKFILKLGYAPLKALFKAFMEFLKTSWNVSFNAIKSFGSDVWSIFGTLAPGTQVVLGTISASSLLLGGIWWGPCRSSAHQLYCKCVCFMLSDFSSSSLHSPQPRRPTC